MTTWMALEYYAKRNRSDRKGQEPYDFTHMGDIKQKATNKTNAQTQTTEDWLPEGKREGRKDEEDKRGQMYGDGGRIDFGW